MKTLKHLLENNERWREGLKESRPDFFDRLSEQQSPEYVWIGCADSRVSAANIVGLMPGEVFVHRNIANLVIHTDMNCLSVLQYAIDVLGVKHVIVCGHYGCGGVRAAVENKRHGLIDNWLRHIQDTAVLYDRVLSKIQDEEERINRLCELNVIEQVLNVGETTIVQDAWNRGQAVRVHGWIYDLRDGKISDIGVHLECNDDLDPLRQRAAIVSVER